MTEHEVIEQLIKVITVLVEYLGCKVEISQYDFQRIEERKLELIKWHNVKEKTIVLEVKKLKKDDAQQPNICM